MDATQDNQNDSGTGWCEVKKKCRSNIKSSTYRSLPATKKTHELPIKGRITPTEDLRDPKICLPSYAPDAPQFKDSDNHVNNKDADECAQPFGDHLEKSAVPLQHMKTEFLSKLSSEPNCEHHNKTVIDAPKFKWGNLDDEDLSEYLKMDEADRIAKILPTGVHDSSQGNQDEGSKKEEVDESLIGEADIKTIKSAKKTSESEETDIKSNVESEEHRKDVAVAVSENSELASEFTDEELQRCFDSHDISDKICVKDLTDSGSGMTLPNSQSVLEKSSLTNCSGLDSANSVDDTEHVSGSQSDVNVTHQEQDGDMRECKQSIEFSVAASMLMGNFEESKSGESKERFRQRLWCYLFENLNRAIDELYFLCELECDMEQIQEALLVLKEAGLDFTELKSRVEGFEKVKKHPGSSQFLFGGNLASSFPGKVEHRRPHAIAWEVRRMACSPHRAEILSSSLEAFKKVQQITAQKNLTSQSKRRETCKLLEMKASCSDAPSKTLSSDCSVSCADFFSKTNSKPVHNDVTKSPTHSMESVNEVETLVNKDVTDTCCSTPHFVPMKEVGACNTPQSDLAEEVILQISKDEKEPVVATNAERTSRSVEKRVSIVDNQRDKKTPKARSSMDAWKVKRNWEDVLSSPLKSINRASRSPCAGWKSAERVKVLHDKLMSPERKRKSPMEMKKEVDEKQARATRIRRELENERVQRLQKTTEKLNRVSEWQAVRSNKLREGMHARQQRGESRHEAHLAEIARRAGDESSKVSEVRFITSLNEENKKLSLRQKLQDSELRRAERLQIIKIKQKEDVAREEAVLERRRIIEAERLQRLAEAQRRKEEAKARREEERKAASAAREARAVEQVRKKEVRAKAQQEVAELQAQKLMEKLRESELRRKVYLEQIRERAAMESREQASPLTRLSLNRDGQPRNCSILGVIDNDASAEKDNSVAKQASAGKNLPGPALRTPVQHHALKKRIKKIRQRLMGKKYDFIEPPAGPEGGGMGSLAVSAAARSKIGRWLQDLQRCQLARKAGASGVGFIVAEMVKYFEGKPAELHAARQAGLVDFIATALPASHTSKVEASQTTLSLLKILKVLLALAANRSYFIARNLLPPLIPMLSAALENFSSQDLVSLSTSSITASGTEKVLNDEKMDAAGEVLNGLLECVMLIMNHNTNDERQISMKDDYVELLVACEVIHHLRDLFSLFDRPQVEGAPFPAPVLFGLNLLQALTAPRGKVLGAPYEPQLSMMLERREAASSVHGSSTKASINEFLIPESTHSASSMKGEVKQKKRLSTEDQTANDFQVGEGQDGIISVSESGMDEIVDACSRRPWSENTQNKDTESKESKIFSSNITSEPSRLDETQKGSLHDSSWVCAVEAKAPESSNEKIQTRWPACHPTSFLVSAIAETGLVGLPSLLTAVLLQTNPRSTPEQAAAVLPANFEEVATCVLKVLNNLARLDLGLVQSLLAMPDLEMEFFHLVSFLITHCTSKWNSSTDQVACLLLETLLLLGYFALLHPGNQAVLRWGKSPTILHKICDLPFAFFSDPLLMPVLIGTLLAVCYGSEQNRDVIREELSMEMLLSLLKTSTTESLVDRDDNDKDVKDDVMNVEQTIDVPVKEEKLENLLLQEDYIIPLKEEIKRVIDEPVASDTETSSTIRQLTTSSRLGKSDISPSPNRRLSKSVVKAAGSNDMEQYSGKENNGRSSFGRSVTRGTTSASPEIQSSQSKKGKVSSNDSSSKVSVTNLPSSKSKPPVASDHQKNIDILPTSTDVSEPGLYLRSDLLLQNRFPPCLLDRAQDFFSAVL